MTAADVRRAQRRGALALAEREARRVVSLWTQTVLPAVVTAAVFLLVIGEALGERLAPATGERYTEFLLPGLLVVTVAGQAFANPSTSIFQAKSEGYIDAILASPLRSWQVAAAYWSGGVVRAAAAAFAVALVGRALGAAPADPVVVASALAATASVFAALGVVTGLWADSFDQHTFVANVIVAPLALLGGVFYEPEDLAEPWATLTRLDPVYHLTAATRDGFSGDAWPAPAVGASFVIALAALAIAARLVARGWRLKP